MNMARTLLCAICTSIGLPLHADMRDDPLLTMVQSEFEYLPNDQQGTIEWDVDAWIGRDLAKFRIKSSGSRLISEPSSEQGHSNIELLYSRAVKTNWDQQFGIRHDFRPDHDGQSRDWLSFGYIGIAPFYIEVDARVFIGEKSSSQLLLEMEREFMITQEWVLTSEMDLVFNGRTNHQFGEGSGLSEIEFSLRLGYEANGNRKFQPFVGLSAHQTFGSTRRIEKFNGEPSGSLDGLLGIHFWF